MHQPHPRLRCHQAAPAGHLVQRRLRRRRHHAADRRRNACRSRRYLRRRTRARRRCRQRQRHARRCATLRERHFHRLRPGSARQGARTGAGGGLSVRFLEADVEDLPFDDDSFDVVVSTFGSMFAPDHERTAREMMRVLRRAAALGWRTGRRKDSSAGCSRSSARTYRRRRV